MSIYFPTNNHNDIPQEVLRYLKLSQDEGGVSLRLFDVCTKRAHGDTHHSLIVQG